MKKTSKANFVVLLGIAAIMSGCGASAAEKQRALVFVKTTPPSPRTPVAMYPTSFVKETK